MSKRNTEGQPSRLAFWLGWFSPVFLIFILLPLWISIWLLIAYFGPVINLGWIFLTISVIAAVVVFLIPKKHPNWRINMYQTMIIAFVVALYIILGYYFNWWNILWF